MLHIDKNTKLPNFLIIGAAKSGTSSLYRYIKEHPEIFLSNPKEPKFITSNFIQYPYRGKGDNKIKTITKIDDYLNLFDDIQEEKAIGEASADNLYYHKKAIPVIKKLLGDTKIVIMLRNPADRAFSSYNHLIRDNRENYSFEKALKKENYRISNNYNFLWHYKKVGLYYNQVKAYLDNFSQVKIFLFENLINKKEELLKELFGFLEVNDNYLPKNIDLVYNKTGIVKSKKLKDFFDKNFIDKPPAVIRNLAKIIPQNIKDSITTYVANKNLKKQEIKKDTKQYLINYFREDILQLQTLINRDLSGWLK